MSSCKAIADEIRRGMWRPTPAFVYKLWRMFSERCRDPWSLLALTARVKLAPCVGAESPWFCRPLSEALEEPRTSQAALEACKWIQLLWKTAWRHLGKLHI